MAQLKSGQTNYKLIQLYAGIFPRLFWIPFFFDIHCFCLFFLLVLHLCLLFCFDIFTKMSRNSSTYLWAGSICVFNRRVKKLTALWMLFLAVCLVFYKPSFCVSNLLSGQTLSELTFKIQCTYRKHLFSNYTQLANNY